MVIVSIWLNLFELPDCKEYVLFAALIDAEPTDIERAFFRHQRWIIWQIMLDASDQITANRKNVCEEGIFGVLNSISVADDRIATGSEVIPASALNSAS